MRQKIYSLTKKDFEISFFSGSGAGGQHRNKHQNCVRMFHRPSGAKSTGADCKSKDQNLKNAFKRITASNAFKRITASNAFKNWLNIEIAEAAGRMSDIDKIVDDAMRPENLKVEYL